VMSALPKALARRGHRVMAVAPRYAAYAEGWETGVRLKIRVCNQDHEVRVPYTLNPNQLLLVNAFLRDLHMGKRPSGVGHLAEATGKGSLGDSWPPLRGKSEQGRCSCGFQYGLLAGPVP